MKKNRRQAEERVNTNTTRRGQESQEAQRNKVILIVAILFFLLGLLLMAQAYGWNLFERFGVNPGTRTNTGSGTTNQTGQPGQPGRPGSQGGTGAGGSNAGGNQGGQNGGAEDPNALQDLNVNVKTDTGLDVDAGIKDGQLNIDPQVNPNAQGGVGGEASVNDNKVLDTGNLLR